MSRFTESDGPFTFEEAHECFYVGSSYFRKVQRRGEPDQEENCTFEMNRLMRLVDNQYRQIEALKAEQRSAELKAAAIREGERRRFHHEVLCRVLDKLVDARMRREIVSLISEQVALAKEYADLAYPPPNGEP